MDLCNNAVMLALHNLVINPDWNDYLEDAILSSLRLCNCAMTQSEVKQEMGRNRDTFGALTASISIPDIFESPLQCTLLLHTGLCVRRVGYTAFNRIWANYTPMSSGQGDSHILFLCFIWLFPPYPLFQYHCCLWKKVKHAFTLCLEWFATDCPLQIHLPVNIL